jgi:hypothetical protein
MSSTVVLDRPARQASPDSLTRDASPAPLPSTRRPLDELFTPGPEAALAPASGTAPALTDLIFDQFEIPSTPPAEGTEAQAAASFKIDSFDKASWAASRVLAAQARMADRAALAQAYKTRIDSWLADSNKADEDTSAYLSLLLKPYVEDELVRARSRSRTLLMVTAQASLRKSPDRISILDEAVAMAYLEAQHPSAIVTKKTISLSTLRTLIFTEGEAVPGVEASLGSDNLYLKPRA